MKLSEAIRLGAMMGPQTRGELFSHGGGSCAMGAALAAIGSPMDLLMSQGWLPWVERWPALASFLGGRCHICDYNHGRTGNRLVHLNDAHKWTREQIADFVETIERAQEPVVEPDAEAATGHGRY